jgi:hypothetical protein
MSSFAQGKQLKKAQLAYDQYEFHKAMDFYKRAYSKSSDKTQKNSNEFSFG